MMLPPLLVLLMLAATSTALGLLVELVTATLLVAWLWQGFSWLGSPLAGPDDPSRPVSCEKLLTRPLLTGVISNYLLTRPARLWQRPDPIRGSDHDRGMPWLSAVLMVAAVAGLVVLSSFRPFWMSKLCWGWKTCSINSIDSDGRKHPRSTDPREN